MSSPAVPPASAPVWSFRPLLLLVALPFYLLDQATKWTVLRHLDYGAEWPVWPGFFSLVHWRNTGAAFSVMSDSNRFFIALSVAAAVALCGWAWRAAGRGVAGIPGEPGLLENRWSRLGWALLLAGILGNLTDRILHGSVVDFLLFDLHIPFANPWPAFNVADACICTAAALFILHSFCSKDLQKEEKKEESKV